MGSRRRCCLDEAENPRFIDEALSSWSERVVLQTVNSAGLSIGGRVSLQASPGGDPDIDTHA